MVLLIAPWSIFWERNLLVDTLPLLGGVVQLAVVRGAVSGVGAVNLGAGAWELLAWLRAGVRGLRLHGTGAARPERVASVSALSEDTRSCTEDR